MAGEITLDLAAFRAGFPAFANVTTYPDATIEVFWNRGTGYVSSLNYGRLRDAARADALNLMAAHLLTLQDTVNAGEVAGIVTASSIDMISVTLKEPPAANQWQWFLNLTPYGQQLLALLTVRSSGGFYIGGLPERSGFRRVYGGFNGPRNS